MAYQHKTNPVEHSEQEIANESYSDTYKIAIQGNYGYDSVTDSFLPMSADISYAYMAYTNTNTTTDTYKYYQGGVSGSLVATITIIYTDTSKTVVSTVTRS